MRFFFNRRRKIRQVRKIYRTLLEHTPKAERPALRVAVKTFPRQPVQ